MAHSLIRIKRELLNTPHLIEPQSFHAILDYINKRNEGSAELVTPEAASWDDVDGDYSHHFVEDTKTGIMSVSGPLTYRTTGWEAWCGGTSYEMLKDQMEYFVAKGAKTVVMMVDSGGGQAHGMMDSANYIRKLADENGIKIVSYVDGMSASAAYGISCISDEIVMSADSQVGSIGVLIQLYNDRKALEMEGYERTFITAGKDKVPFDKDGSFTEAFIDRLQEQVDMLYEGFTTHVAGHRNLELQAVKDTEANVFMSQEALSLGLADKVMTAEEFSEYLAEYAQSNLEGTEMGSLKNALRLTNREDQAEMAKLQELEALLASEQTARATSEAALAAAMTELASTQEALTALSAELDDFRAAAEAQREAAAQAAVEARRAKLAAAVPAAEVETYMTNMASLDDTAFHFMADELLADKAARAEGFKAIGSEGAEAEDVGEVDAFEAIRLAGIARAKAMASR